MSSDKGNDKVGRTFYDLLSPLIGVFQQRLYLFFATIVILFFGVWGLTHWNAKPNEKISLWFGLIEYTKKGAPPISTPSSTASSPVPSPSHSPTKTPTSVSLQRMQLRNEPLTVSYGEARQFFELEPNWQPRQYVQNNFEDQGDVVVDHATGLMWQKSGSPDPLRLSDNAAGIYIKQLNFEQFAGFNDWRMPTVPELLSLLEPVKQASDKFYINPIFDAIRQRQCWSADKSEPKSTWYVDFSNGTLRHSDTYWTKYVRAVRSLQ